MIPTDEQREAAACALESRTDHPYRAMSFLDYKESGGGSRILFPLCLQLQIELLAAQKDLAECYRLSGADPDGDEDWRLAAHAVNEVKRLRAESDEADDLLLKAQ